MTYEKIDRLTPDVTHGGKVGKWYHGRFYERPRPKDPIRPIIPLKPVEEVKQTPKKPDQTGKSNKDEVPANADSK